MTEHQWQGAWMREFERAKNGYDVDTNQNYGQKPVLE
jgi:hypothetical protein